MTSDPTLTSFANPDVLAFYRELPFNYRQSAQEHAKTIRRANALTRYAVLAPLLRKRASVLDVGCGAGWFSLNAAYHYGCDVTGIDFNEVAIERARDVGRVLATTVKFQQADLFQFQNPLGYDVVASIGVLHHTNDCLAALSHICANLVKQDGHVFIGLYHLHGRRPFLEYFQKLKNEGASEAEMLDHYRKLHPLSDETHLRSWFRDQVLHPHETQHTLREVLPILEANGMALVSTSINDFGSVGNLATLFEAEEKLDLIANERLRQNQYYPGFFLFLARKVQAV